MARFIFKIIPEFPFGIIPSLIPQLTIGDVRGIQVTDSSVRFRMPDGSAIFRGENIELGISLDSMLQLDGFEAFGGRINSMTALYKGIAAITVTGLTVTVADLFGALEVDELRYVQVLFRGADSITLTNRLDEISGYGGNDTIQGLGGNDSISGGAGNDRLFGGAGTDSLYGNAGNDVLFGGADYNLMEGGAGNDRFYAGSGSNSSFGGNGNDQVFGGAGQETIYGDNGADRLFGRGAYDYISGGDGDDLISGGAGNDALVGGAGADRFVFDAAPGAANSDTIYGFVSGEDRILLDDDVFRALGGPGGLAGAAFRVGLNATDASDRIIYDRPTGNLYYDRDGVGGSAKVLFATLDAGPALTAGDFLIVG